MSQNQYTLPDSGGGEYRAGDNSRAKAIASMNAGFGDPPEIIAYMLKLDLTAGELQMRNAASNAWIVLAKWTGTKMVWRHSEINDLTALLAPAIEDKVLIFDASAPNENKSIALTDLWKIVNAFPELVGLEPDADFLPIFDTSAGEIRKISPRKLSGFIEGNPVATDAGSAIILADNVPELANALEVDVWLEAVSTNANGQGPMLQIGPAGAVMTAGYDTNVSGVGSGTTRYENGLGPVRHTNYLASQAINATIKLKRNSLATQAWRATATATTAGLPGVYLTDGGVTLANPFADMRLVTPGGALFDGGLAGFNIIR